MSNQLTFVPGKVYVDRDGGRYKFLTYAEEAEPSEQVVFVNLSQGYVCTRYKDGAVSSTLQNNYDIVAEYREPPKPIEVVRWAIFGHSELLYWAFPNEAIASQEAIWFTEQNPGNEVYVVKLTGSYTPRGDK